MPHHSPPRDVILAKLRSRVRANLAVEEAFVSALLDLMNEHRDRMNLNEIQDATSLVRRHRVGMIKQRALMGALGIDV